MTYFLTKHDPYSYLTKISSKQTFWQSSIKIKAKLWPLEGEQGFKEIWPSDIVFDPTWPMFEIDRDITKRNILVKFIKIEAKLWPLEGEQVLEQILPSELDFDPTWPIFEVD